MDSVGVPAAAAVDSRLTELEGVLARHQRTVDGLLRDVRTLTEVVVAASQSDDDEPSDRRSRVPVPEWRCKLCSKRLGVLSRDGGVLTVKHKQLIMSVHGGKVQIRCSDCGTENTMEWADPTVTVGAASKVDAQRAAAV